MLSLFTIFYDCFPVMVPSYLMRYRSVSLFFGIRMPPDRILFFSLFYPGAAYPKPEGFLVKFAARFSGTRRNTGCSVAENMPPRVVNALEMININNHQAPQKLG